MASIALTSVGKLIELLNEATAGEDAYVRVLSANRLALGVDPLQERCFFPAVRPSRQ